VKASFTVDELARRWAVHPQTIRRLIQHEELKAYRHHGSIRVLTTEMEKFETLGGVMANRKPLTEMDFSKALSYFEPYRGAKEKLDALIAEQLSKERELEDLRRQAATSVAPVREQAEKFLREGSMDKMGPDINEQRSTLAREIRVLNEAIRLQRDNLDYARRRASHRYCEMLAAQWRQEIIGPTVEALKALQVALARERDIHERLRDAGVSDDYFPGVALLGDPRDPNSLINLKIAEIENDYELT
jgi:excisionase family DNA binding protein